MMGGQQRGWIIIGIDLLVVLGVYLLYSQFMVAPTSNTLNVSDALHYELTVDPVRGETIPVTFAVSNQSSADQTTDLPEGILLFLARGTRTDQRDKFWATQPLEPGSITLSSGETRSWSYTPKLPEGVEEQLYVALFIDESRQGKVAVPR